MSAPLPRWVPAPAGTFRVLEWHGREPSVLFLHGLTGVAEVWGPTIDALGARRPRCLAMDQRGHGHSPKPETGYAIGSYVRDAVDVIDELGLAPLNVVGHSMGARVALVLAARFPQVLRSVAIIDIGPEAWRANHEQTVRALDRMPESYPSKEAALGGQPGPAALKVPTLSSARRGCKPFPMGPSSGSQTGRPLGKPWLPSARETTGRNGSAFACRRCSSVAGRARSYASASQRRCAQLIRGCGSSSWRGVGHNVPLLAPGQLVATLRDFWSTVAGSR